VEDTITVIARFVIWYPNRYVRGRSSSTKAAALTAKLSFSTTPAQGETHKVLILEIGLAKVTEMILGDRVYLSTSGV
jgi:hypothetical protein